MRFLALTGPNGPLWPEISSVSPVAASGLLPLLPSALLAADPEADAGVAHHVVGSVPSAGLTGQDALPDRGVDNVCSKMHPTLFTGYRRNRPNSTIEGVDRTFVISVRFDNGHPGGVEICWYSG